MGGDAGRLSDIDDEVVPVMEAEDGDNSWEVAERYDDPPPAPLPPKPRIGAILQLLRLMAPNTITIGLRTELPIDTNDYLRWYHSWSKTTLLDLALSLVLVLSQSRVLHSRWIRYVGRS